ncbi:MAG: DUF2723 domain-containing protein [Deltaproteobacteria bacterium]|nr:DUF2723 domain-containing protein [Deltaproteobacteria bacterium]
MKLGRVVEAWSGPAAAGLAALGVFAAALWTADVAPGPGDGGEVAAAAVEFRPAGPTGHAAALGPAKAAALLPAGSVSFRLGLLSAALLALSAALVAAAALRLLRAIAGPGGPAHAAVAGAIGLAAGLAGPALACAGPGPFALQAALGAVVLWACVAAVTADPAAPAGATGLLVAGAFAAGLAAANHAPSGLPLGPPLLLAAALRLARSPRGAAVGGESLLAVRVSWMVAGFAVGLIAIAALPLRSAELADPALLLRTVLSRSAAAAARTDPIPAGWEATGSVWASLTGALGPAALAAACLALGSMALVRATRAAALALLAFVVGPVALRSGAGFDRAPDEVAAYLAVPSMALALALAAPAGLAIGLARTGAGWRRGVAWGLVLALLFGALLRHELRSFGPGAAAERGRATLVAADALAEPPPPGAALFVSRVASAALVTHDQAVFGRRPDLAVLLVPRLPEAGYARSRLGEGDDLAPLVSGFLAPASSAGPALVTAAERLAARRPLFAEPGTLTDPLTTRTLLPRGPLLEIVPQALGRTELAAALAAGRGDPTRLGRRATALAGTALGAAVSWDLANAAVVVGRAAASISTPGTGTDATRDGLRSEAARLADEAEATGAPSAVVERLRAALAVDGGPGAPALDDVLAQR